METGMPKVKQREGGSGEIKDREGSKIARKEHFNDRVV